MNLTKKYINSLIETALTEDINYIDVTTDYLIDLNSQSTALLVSKDEGILSGLDIALQVFQYLDKNIKYETYFKDGQQIKNKDLIAKISGPTTALLKGERTALNILQHTSGISTKTSKFVKIAKPYGVTITDTRKTLPGLRPLQKYAVKIGGAKNHRFNLSDAAMIKDNHISAYGSISNAISALRTQIGHMTKIEIEVKNLKELKQAIEAKADIIMLDNMDTDTIKKAVDINNNQTILEASGNITLDNIEQIAKTGVNIISLGCLTHSNKAFDISIIFE